MTFADLGGRVRHAVALFAGRGVTSLRVALVMPSEVSSLIQLIALIELGNTVLLVDTDLTEVELSRLVSEFGPHAIVDGPTIALQDPTLGRVDDLDYPSIVLTTSGTGGKPKLVKRSWDRALIGGRSFGQAIAASRDDVLLITTPLHHSYAVSVGLMTALACGCGVVLARRPSSRQFWELADQATVALSIPVLYRWFLAEATAPDCLRLAVSAGESLTEADTYLASSAGLTLANHYGTTEAGPLTFGIPTVSGSVGSALPGVGVRIGSDSELEVRSPAAATDLIDASGRMPVRQSDGWIGTGDMATIGASGEVTLTGRRSSWVKVGGRRVDLEAVEERLRQHLSVSEVACVGRDRPDGGTEIVAIVESENKDLSRRELLQMARGGLSAHQVPSSFLVTDRLPRTSSGKIRRADLPALAARLSQRLPD